MYGTYREFDLLVDQAKRVAGRLRRFTVRVLDSPLGGSGIVVQDVETKQATQLAKVLQGLDARGLDADGIIGLGAALADLLLPTDVRSLLVRSLDALGQEEGLRLRLRLDPLLAPIPWEYLFLPRQAGQRDATGFLALDPRVSIVRHENVAGPLPSNGPPRKRRAVVALASPNDPQFPKLALDTEQANIKAAFANAPNVTAEYVDHATIRGLADRIGQDRVDVFHFAGHGFEDALVLEEDSGAAARYSAEQLAVNLQSRGTLLAVLGACDSGRRADDNQWRGVAIRLLAAGIPAAVAMQYRIGDMNAIEFGQACYRALAAGVGIDGAVAAGRLAIFNRMDPHRRKVTRAGFWRDWGVPVLYLSPGASVDLASIANRRERAKAGKQATLTVDDRIVRITRAGSYVGAQVGEMLSGLLDVRLSADQVEGSVVGAELERAEAGKIHVALKLNVVTAPVVGVKVKTLGGS